LFIDARHIYIQIDRAHRAYTSEQIERLANIVRLWRGETRENDAGSDLELARLFGLGGYKDIPGLCKVATRAEIATQDWSLNPGRYVGVAPGETQSDADFSTKLEAMQEELEILNTEAARLQAVIAQNVAEVLA
jgi:type I restriction enzyme M protein